MVLPTSRAAGLQAIRLWLEISFDRKEQERYTLGLQIELLFLGKGAMRCSYKLGRKLFSLREDHLLTVSKASRVRVFLLSSIDHDQ
jgi:hypothetical protein